MRLNHLNLVVTNVAEAIDFFEKYFGFTCTETKGENVIAILKGTGNFTLVIMSSKNNDNQYPPAFHIGFMQDNMNEVVTIYNNLRTGGFNVGQEPKNIRDSFGFYFTFDNLMIEVGYYLN